MTGEQILVLVIVGPFAWAATAILCAIAVAAWREDNRPRKGPKGGANVREVGTRQG
jgi:hypothetical protein